MNNGQLSPNQTNNEFKNRFDIKTLILFMTIILLATVIILWNPDIDTKYHEDKIATLTAQVEISKKPGGLVTPYPVDLLNYPEQTNGIVMGAVVILLIVVGGTLGVIQHKK
jgi:hypothetical protein